MSLYDGLSDDQSIKDTGAVSGWGSSMKLLKTQKELGQAKKQQSLMGSKKRQGPTVAPVVDLRGKGRSSEPRMPTNADVLYFNQLTGKMEKESTRRSGSNATSAVPFIGSEAPNISSTFLGVADEYDPLHPNDYEDILKRLKDKRQKERDEERKKEMDERERRRRERHAERDRADGHSPRSGDEEEQYDQRGRPSGGHRGRYNRHDEEEEEGDEREKRKYDRRSGGMGAAIAPPSSLIEQDKVTAPPQDNRDGQGGGGGYAVAGGGSVAERIMSKMGYALGQGLGKNKQGMSTALQVEKTGKRAGKIIHERDIPKLEAIRPEVSNTNALKNPSKVVLLQNMVGPGEVDEELEPETLEECQKYGKCLKCVIFEMPNSPEDEAVRIFVEFEKIDSAIRAIIDMNGRYFGGRTVKACFYNLDKFRRLDLADLVD